MSVLPDYYRGDTLEKLRFESAFVDEPPGVVTSARLQFRHVTKKGVDSIASFLSSDDSLIIVDSANWIIETVPVVLPITFPGQTVYDLEVTYVDSEDGLTKILTTAKGTMLVVADVTRT